MQILLAAGILVTGLALLAVRRKRKSDGAQSFSTEPLSGEWLAEARARDDHGY